MTSFLGFPLLALWIMGAPLIGALISLAMPAPRHNTMPRLRRRDHIDTAPESRMRAAQTPANQTPTGQMGASPYPRH